MLLQVQTSCGYGVPFLTTAPTSSEDAKSSKEETKPVLKDRDTMGHWSHQKVETNKMLEWQAHYNSSSLDGQPGLRSAIRGNGDQVWAKLVKARLRTISAQREAVVMGLIMGGALVLLLQMVWGMVDMG